MNGYSTRFAAAAVLWTLALGLGLVGTVDHDPAIRFWALMVALAATLISAHLIVCAAVKAERIRVEHLVDGLIERARERADAGVRRVH